MAQAGRQKKLVWAISSSLPHRFTPRGRVRRWGQVLLPGKAFLKPIAKLAAHELILTVNKKDGH